MRDAARIRLQFPEIDTDGDGDVDTGTDTHVCITGNFSWTGITREPVRSDCSETSLDTWENLVATYQAGREIEMGSISMDVDWSPDGPTTTGGRVFAAFKSGLNGTWKIKFPAAPTETTGPILELNGFLTGFRPITNVMGKGDESRSKANITIKLSGQWTLTAAS